MGAINGEGYIRGIYEEGCKWGSKMVKKAGINRGINGGYI